MKRSIRRMISASLPALLLAAAFAPSPATAQADLPSGAEVCDRYVEAVGGLEAWDGIENIKTLATIEMPAQGMTMDITIWSARPVKMYSLIESPALGKIERGTDGDIVWDRSLMSGPSVKEGEERAQFLREATFKSDVYWRKVYESAECTAVDTLEGEPCYKVVLRPAEGEPRTVYYSVETGLIRRVDTEVETPMGRVPVKTWLSDYRETGGVIQDWMAVVDVLGQKRIITTRSIELDVEIEPGLFDPPEDVKALLETE